MAIYRVKVRQWVEEVAYVEIEAATKAEAKEKAYDESIDADWMDGNDVKDFQVISVTETMEAA